MTFTECVPEFQTEMQRLAQQFNRSVEYIWKRWQHYEHVCDILGQSAIVEEFEKSLERVA